MPLDRSRAPAGPSCRGCAAALPNAARYCSRCGRPVEDDPVPERRRVTVVFADLSGFTGLTETHDPEDVRAAVEQFFARAGAVVREWGGRVDQFAGDAVMAVFGDRDVHEDDAERAVQAALGVRDAAATVDLVTDDGAVTTLSAHVGVATGMTVTASQAWPSGVTSPLGDAVNVAARLQTLARDGQVLLCGTTRALLGGRVGAAPIGPHRLRGRDRPVEVFVAETVSATPGTLLPGSGPRRSRFVGRDADLAVLVTAWRRLLVEGRGDAVEVVGEAGVGKSRILDELRTLAGADASRLRWWEGAARATGVPSAHDPVRQVVAAAAGIGAGDDEPAVRQRLGDLVTDLGLAGEDVLGPLQRLFAAQDDDEAEQDREGFRVRLGPAVGSLLLAAAARGPVVVCLQDLHWADPSTTAVLAPLVDRVRRHVLVLASRRPGAPEVGAAPTDPLWARTLRLGDLTTTDVGELLRSRLGSVVRPDLVELVGERSGGNPFFAEELLNGLLDADVVADSPAGWHLLDAAAAGQVPATVHGVVAARLDLLPPAVRACARRASVYGRDLTVEDVEGLGPGDPRPALAALVEADLLQRVDEHRYRYKHSLILDVAGSGLTKQERRDLHLAAARSLESRAGHRRTELAERLGAHYREAGAVAPAVHHLSVAADAALDTYAVAEADALYGDAYRLLVRRGDAAQRVGLLGPLLVRWALVHYYRGSWRVATDLLERHDAEIRACPDRAVAGLSLAWRGFSAAIARSAVTEALELLDEAVAVGHDLDHAELLAHACTWRAWALFLAGRHADAIADARTVDAVSGRLVDARFPRTKSAGALGLAHIGLGELTEARRVAGWLVDTGARTGSSRATSMGLSVLSLAATVGGDPEEGARTGARAVAAASDPIYTDMARLMAVHGMVAAGHLDAARAVLADMVASCTELRLDGLLLAVASAHGVLQVMEGDLDAGMRRLEASVVRADRDGSRFLACLARVYRAGVRARSVTGATAVPVAALLRHPGFVVRHALPARRRAAGELEDLLLTLPERGAAGLRLLVADELGALLRHQGRSARATEVAQQHRSPDGG